MSSIMIYYGKIKIQTAYLINKQTRWEMNSCDQEILYTELHYHTKLK